MLDSSLVKEIKDKSTRGAFNSRTAFILAAVGSAVGLGNIWRFPYVAYSNGGGAFIIPYVFALLAVGIPMLFLDFAIGHRYRASSPLAFRRLHKLTEPIGWWHMCICFIIGIYYAVILAWSAMYFVYSFTKAWGEDPGTFFTEQFTQSVPAEQAHIGFHYISQIFTPMLIVWVAVIAVLTLGVQKGIAGVNKIFMPLLTVMFLIMVGVALTLPGATDGINAFFTPKWDALLDSGVWAAAFGQIFFSLSVAFGIQQTYASYLPKNSDLTGSGLVVGFANSSFELLSGIGVFAVLGFMAQVQGVGVDETASAGIGLAFIAFPTIINQAPAGTLIGILFFGSLTFAAFTSMISIIEALIASIEDKLGLKRVPSVLLVGVPMALTSLLLFPTTTGLNLLDVLDNFVNNFGIVTVALISTITLTAAFGALPTLRNHLNRSSSFKLGRGWQVLVGGVTPVILGYILINEVQKVLTDGYGGMPSWFIDVFGWGMTVALVIVAFVLSSLPWSMRSAASKFDTDGDKLPPPILDRLVDSGHLQEVLDDPTIASEELEALERYRRSQIEGRKDI